MQKNAKDFFKTFGNCLSIFAIRYLTTESVATVATESPDTESESTTVLSTAVLSAFELAAVPFPQLPRTVANTVTNTKLKIVFLILLSLYKFIIKIIIVFFD